MDRNNHTPTIVMSDGRNRGPMDDYLAQKRAEKAELVRRARRKGNEALRAQRESDRRVGRTWKPLG